LHIFQEYGKTPVLIDKLNKAVKLGTMMLYPQWPSAS